MIRSLAILSLLGLFFSACFLALPLSILYAAKPEQVALRNVKIAILMGRPGLSLDTPRYLPFFSKAVELAIQDRKQELARAGLKAEISMVYMEEDATQTYRNFEELMKSDVLVGVGPQSSDEITTGLSLIRGSDLLIVSPSATSTELLKEAPNLLLFAGTNQEAAQITEKFISREFPHKKMASIVAWDSDYAQNFYKNLSEDFKKRLDLYKATEETGSVPRVVAEAMKKKPELIILPNFPVTTAAYIRQFVEAGYQGVFVGADSWGEGADGRFGKIMGNTPFEGYMVRQFSLFSKNAAEQRIRERLASQLPNTSYGSLVIAYYDSALYVIDLLISAGARATRKDILERSKKTKFFKGLMGTACLSEVNCPTRNFNIVKVKNGEFSLYKEFKK